MRRKQWIPYKDRVRRFWPVVLLACAMFAWSAAPVQVKADNAQDIPVTLEQYVASLERARQLLGGSDTDLDAARAELAAIHQVQLSSGTVIAVDPLLGDPGEDLPIEHARARIQTVLAQLRAADRDNTDARLDVLAAVLTGPEFTAHDSWWDILRRWLAEWWDRLFPQPENSPAATAIGSSASEVISWVVGAAGVIGLVLLLAHWLRGFLADFVGEADAVIGDNLGGELPQTPAEARRRAANRAASGDFRDAVRHLYLSALLTLEQNGLVPADRSLTNRELLARVGASHPMRPHLQPVVDTFDDVWYGVHEPDAQTYQLYTQSIDELEDLAHRSTKEPAP